jgi:hypothetical protein
VELLEHLAVPMLVAVTTQYSHLLLLLAVAVVEMLEQAHQVIQV